MGAITKQALEATQAISTIACTRGVGPQDKLIVLGQVQWHLDGVLRKLVEDRDASANVSTCVSTQTGD